MFVCVDFFPFTYSKFPRPQDVVQLPHQEYANPASTFFSVSVAVPQSKIMGDIFRLAQIKAVVFDTNFGLWTASSPAASASACAGGWHLFD